MLEGLRIVEIGECMAVQVAGLMLAALGADVLKVERPGGDPARGTAPFASWNRGKRSIELDLDNDEGGAELDRRLAGADVLLHQFSPARAARRGLDDTTLGERYPHLVVSAVTGSPHDHPDVERSDDELLVAARLGVLYENDGHRPGPIVYRYRQGSWSAAHLAAAAILARLTMRLESGRGGAAHTSIYQGFMATLPLVWARNSSGPMPNPETYPLAARPAANQLYQCQDGAWLQIMDPSQQFDFGSLPTMWEVMAEGVEIDTPEGLAQAFRSRSSERWLTDLQAADIAVELAQPMGEVLRHPEAVANGYAVQVDDPALGATIQANVPFTVDGRPLPAPPAPQLGEGGERAWDERVEPKAGNRPTEVLAGVRVLDFGMFLAGPMGPAMMGDMGADVIKVEALTGDRIRFMHRYYQAASRSKRSLALDLTHPGAEPILDRLVAWAEVIHHNMRMKGSAKLGLTAENFRRINPNASFNYSSAYGQLGERANWPGYDSIFNAIGGWEFENAGEGNRPVFNRPGTMDVGTAQSALVELMASLYARRAGGVAHTTQTSLLGLAVFTQGERLIGPEGELTETYHLDAAQTGFSPYHRIFECSGGEWIAVAAHREAERAGLRSVLGEDEGGFAERALASPANELLERLESAGVPSDAVTFEDAMNRFFDDPLNRDLGLVSALEQPLYGIVEQPGAFWNFGDVPIRLRRAAPAIGQHTDEIMRQLGFSDAEIANFREQDVIA